MVTVEMTDVLGPNALDVARGPCGWFTRAVCSGTVASSSALSSLSTSSKELKPVMSAAALFLELVIGSGADADVSGIGSEVEQVWPLKWVIWKK